MKEARTKMRMESDEEMEMVMEEMILKEMKLVMSEKGYGLGN